MAGFAALGMAPARPAASGGRMQACTAQWKAQGLSRAEYRPFLVKCLKGGASTAPAPVKVAVVRTTEAPRPPKIKSARHGNGVQANRMKTCGAQWRQMKAAGTTGGQTWRQFVSGCLKKTP